MIRLFLFSTLTTLNFHSFATEQIDDIFTIGFKGKTYPIAERPLSQKFDNETIRLILGPDFCTASWRGYKARWQLLDGKLMLNSMQKNPCERKFNPVSSGDFFGTQEYPIHADWFTGKITLMVGEESYRYENGVQIGYDQDVFVFNFQNGKLISKGMEELKYRYKKRFLEPKDEH
ncbi:hypothetical protein [Pseudoalteromonas sp. R3]|uniref:hypothetical protein n=1 Tax=Pseudoalteromonas sp. R3 TaxID=1709477 RepID=UPI0006B5C041|nr:hypothetical protein [Pseudoalteromonas sp. R3]AZZ98831.1 hypothetical protein ELR70_18035 [Pseudoalteromonas sp. R3]